VVSWQREVLATGERTDAFCPEPVGYINYGADRRCYITVIRRVDLRMEDDMAVSLIANVKITNES
jgi:hypothetical protein